MVGMGDIQYIQRSNIRGYVKKRLDWRDYLFNGDLLYTDAYGRLGMWYFMGFEVLGQLHIAGVQGVLTKKNSWILLSEFSMAFREATFEDL